MTEYQREIDHLAEMNVRKWLLAEHVHQKGKQANHRESVGPYITISREVGAGGSAIAREVGHRLQWDILDHEILDVMAEKYAMPHEAAALLDEKHPSWLEDWFTRWFAGKSYSSSAYFHRLKRILLLAAQHGKVVIVGRGAQFVLPHDRGLSVRVLAPLEYRVQQISLQKGIGQHESLKLVKSLDRQHDEFTQAFLHHNAADPHMYDMVINVEKLTAGDAVELIVDAACCWLAKQEVGKPTTA